MFEIWWPVKTEEQFPYKLQFAPLEGAGCGTWDSLYPLDVTTAGFCGLFWVGFCRTM